MSVVCNLCVTCGIYFFCSFPSFNMHHWNPHFMLYNKMLPTPLTFFNFTYKVKGQYFVKLKGSTKQKSVILMFTSSSISSSWFGSPLDLYAPTRCILKFQQLLQHENNKNISYMLFEGSKEILNLQIHNFVAGMGSASR